MVTTPQQERSRARREALLRAAIELLAEGGARAVTHRAVAARAGLPPASTTYYFDSIHQLTDAALALHVSERVAELEALVAGAVEEGTSPEDVAARVAENLADRAADVVVAQFEIYLEAARNPAVRPPVGEALDAFERLTARALAALGAEDPEAAAPAFLAVVDGFALHRLARPRPRDTEVASLRSALRALFIAHVMPPADQSTWTTLLRSALPRPAAWRADLLQGDPRVDLVVLRTPDLGRARAFYEAIGLALAEERHGDGPGHLAAVLPSGIVFELYPGPPAHGGDVRLGFTVEDVPGTVDAVRSTAGQVLAEPRLAGDGPAAVVADPDGRPIHLSPPAN